MPSNTPGRPPTMPKTLVRAMCAAVTVASLVTVTAPQAGAQKVPVQPTAAANAAPAVVKHTVKRGDTLWDIAKFYLKDPFKWPEVFHANTDIVKNPHWIYPGQVLTIDGSAVKPEVAARTNSDGFVVAQIQTRAQAPTVFAEPKVTSEGDIAGATAIPPALTVRPGEYDAAPYLVDEHAALGESRVIGQVDRPALGLSSDAGYRLFDRIYVTTPAAGSVAVGDSLIIAHVDQTIPDLGRVVEPTGMIRVDSLGSGRQVIGVIIKQFGSIVPGQAIVPLGRSFEKTVVRPVRGSYPVSGKVVWIQGSPRLPSVQTYVILAGGSAHEVHQGDQFTLLDNGRYGDGSESPLGATATVTVVRVTPFGASGIVVHQAQPEIRVGMPGHLTARMP